MFPAETAAPKKSFPLESGLVYDVNEKLIDKLVIERDFVYLKSIIKIDKIFNEWISKKAPFLVGNILCLLHLPMVVKVGKFFANIVLHTFRTIIFFVLTLISLLYLVLGGFAVKNTRTLFKKLAGEFFRSLANLVLFALIKASINLIWHEFKCLGSIFNRKILSLNIMSGTKIYYLTLKLFSKLNNPNYTPMVFDSVYQTNQRSQQ